MKIYRKKKLHSRWETADPICTPARVDSLGFEKILSVFLVASGGAAAALVILTLEMVTGGIPRFSNGGGGSNSGGGSNGGGSQSKPRQFSLGQKRHPWMRKRVDEISAHLRRLLDLRVNGEGLEKAVSDEELIFQMELLLRHLNNEGEDFKLEKLRTGI